jgi:magnesium chelatase family protein
MALARTLGVALTGVHGELVDIEADLAAGLPGVSFTGLADTCVVESRDRIRAAVANSGVDWPNRKITVALLPADVRKSGSRFDLAIALAVLGAGEIVPVSAIADVAWIAELGLDGRLRPVRGVLPSVAAAHAAGARRVVVARASGAEAALVHGVDVRVAADLREVLDFLREGVALPSASRDDGSEHVDDAERPDLADVAGQVIAKRALEIAAAGGHHLYLVGVPGAGKTMLAERLPGLLPLLDDAAALEVTAVHSVAGRLPAHARLIRRAPLQAPHHTATVAALVGGGSHLARPGAISLAHRGVLFLDEAPEFSPRALDAMRQPLESGVVVLHRGGGVVSYPARFQLVLAANPCPCGRPGPRCECAPHVRRRYQHRLSGPLLDRVDLRVAVEAVGHVELLTDAPPEPTHVVALRVAAARRAALERWTGTPWQVNADVPGAALRARRWALPKPALGLAEEFLVRGQLTARGLDRVLRLSWTIADLAGRTVPSGDDVGEALFFRTGEIGAWAA